MGTKAKLQRHPIVKLSHLIPFHRDSIWVYHYSVVGGGEKPVQEGDMAKVWVSTRRIVAIYIVVILYYGIRLNVKYFLPACLYNPILKTISLLR